MQGCECFSSRRHGSAAPLHFAGVRTRPGPAEVASGWDDGGSRYRAAMNDSSPELLAECSRVLGPVRVAELYLRGLSGAYRDRGPGFRALSYTERLVVWDGEHEAARARAAEAAVQQEAIRQTAQAEAEARETRREEERTQFRVAYPGVDIDSWKRSRAGMVHWVPGQECRDCRGAAEGSGAVAGRCLGGEACRFRYRAVLFTRQGGLCAWCSEPLNADLSRTHVDHVIPTSRRGPWADWNLQLLHGRCNAAKAARLTDRAYDLADAHGFVIPDFIAVWEEPASTRKLGRIPRGRPAHWRPASGPVHLVHPGALRGTLCGYSGYTRWWTRVSGDGGKPWNVTCDHCRERRMILGSGTGPAAHGLPY
jgi:hypothetical protein